MNTRAPFVETDIAGPNIDRVWHDQLCTQCGACWGVCPNSNIRIERGPDLDYVFRVKDISRCKACHLCAQVCPGIAVDINTIQNTLFPDEKVDPLLGVIKASYLSRARSETLVRQGASGGSVTALLEFGLSTGKISGGGQQKV